MRRYVPSDLPRILQIEAASFGEADAYPEAWFEELQILHPNGFSVAEVGDDVAGYVIAYMERGVGQIDSIAVDARYRRHGVGRVLLEHALAVLKADGATEVSLEVRTDNEEAIAFYRRYGFRVAGTEEGYYEDGTDAYIMTRQL